MQLPVPVEIHGSSDRHPLGGRRYGSRRLARLCLRPARRASRNRYRHRNRSNRRDLRQRSRSRFGLGSLVPHCKDLTHLHRKWRLKDLYGDSHDSVAPVGATSSARSTLRTAPNRGEGAAPTKTDQLWPVYDQEPPSLLASDLGQCSPKRPQRPLSADAERIEATGLQLLTRPSTSCFLAESCLGRANGPSKFDHPAAHAPRDACHPNRL